MTNFCAPVARSADAGRCGEHYSVNWRDPRVMLNFQFFLQSSAAAAAARRAAAAGFSPVESPRTVAEHSAVAAAGRRAAPAGFR